MLLVDDISDNIASRNPVFWERNIKCKRLRKAFGLLNFETRLEGLVGIQFANFGLAEPQQTASLQRISKRAVCPLMT